MENNIDITDMTDEYIRLVDMLKNRLESKYEIGEAEIVEALVNYPNILGWAIKLLRVTSTDYENALLDYNVWYKAKYNKIRQQLEVGKGKSYKIGKDDVEACIIAEDKDEYTRQKRDLIALNNDMSTARRILRSVEKIENTLNNIAYQIRAEMKSFSVEKRTENRLRQIKEARDEHNDTRKRVTT